MRHRDLRDHADQKRMEERLARLRQDVPPPSAPDARDVADEDELEELSRMVNGSSGPRLEDEDELRAQVSHGKGKAHRHKPARPATQRPSAPHLHSDRSAKPKGVSDRECWHFKQGMCHFGTRCRFKHVATKANSTPGSPRSETSSVSRDSSERDGSSKRHQRPSVPVEEDVGLPLHFAYTPTLLQTSRLEKEFPEMESWSASGTVPSVNPHLCLHVERFFQMANVVGILQSLPTTWQPGDPPDLVDHWGSPSRLWKAIRYACWNSAAARGKTRAEKNQMSAEMAQRWQCVVPSLISNDDMRHHVALGLNLPIAVCRCDALPCEHAPEPVAFLDVHGLYYRAPSEIAALLADTGAVMYSIAHWFNPEQGTGDFWSGEGRWRRDDKSPGIVTMDVDGATVRSYRHSDLGWLARLPQRFGGVALGVDLVSQMPSQRVYAFRVSEDGWVNERDDSTNLSFVSSTSPTVWGSVDLFPQAKALATMRLSVGSIQLYSMGPFWDWSCEDKHVWVSKAMVEQAARYMAGQQRTPETRNNLIMWLERKMRINGAHPDVTAASIHVTALLGMLLHAEESMWAMHAFNDMGVFMAVWNQLLSGTPMRWWHWWMVAAVCLTIAFVPKFVLWGLAAHPAGEFTPWFFNSTTGPSNATATGFEIMRATMPAPEDINMIIFLGFAVLLLVFRYACMWRQRFDASALVSSWNPFGSLRPPRARILAPATFRDVTSVHLATREEFRAAHVGDEGPVGHFAIRAVVPAPKPFVSGSSMELSANPLERRVRYSAYLTYTATFPDVLPSVPSTGPASLAGAASRLAAVYYDKTVEEIVDLNLLGLSRWYADNNFHNWRTMIGSGCVTWGAGRTPEELITWFEGARSRECWDVDQSRFDSHQRQTMKRSTLECLKHLHDECVVGEAQIMAEHEHAHECAIKRLDGRTAHFSYRTATHTASGSGARREECFRVRLEGTAVTGASNTSLNATTTQAKVCYYVLVRHLPRGQNPADHFRILVCGDDTVIKWLRKPLCSQEEFEAGMQNLGFKAKVHVVPEGENAVYCSSLAWMGRAVTGSRAGTCVPVLGPLPFRQLAKFSTMANPPLGFTRKEAARAKALSLYKRANHVPLLGTFIRRVLEYTSGADQRQVDKLVERERLARWAEDSEDGPYDLTPEGVKQFLDRYEISPEGYRQLDALMATHEPDHYYRHPLINHGVALDCDLTGDEGLFQNTDHLVSSPFRRHLDDDPSLMDAKPMSSPDWEADSDEWHPPQMPAMGFDEWFEEYRCNVGGASDPDGKPRAGRAANVLAERRRYVEGDHRSLDYAVSNTDVFVKVEALNKSVEGLDEHFAPRAIECEKEAMIALNGPYDKTLYRVCHAVFPCPKEDAIAHHIRIGGQPDRARPADKCRAWLKRLRPLLLFAAVVLAAAAVAGARADPGTQIQQEARPNLSHPDFRPAPPFADLPDPLFWPDLAARAGRAPTLESRGESTTMPKRVKAARAQAKRQAPTRAKTPAPRRIRAQPPRPPVPPTLGPDMTPTLMPGRRPSLMAAKARAPRPPSGVQRVTAPMAYAAGSDATTAAQMLAPDEAVVKGLLAGPPIPVQDGTTKFSTITKVTVGSVLATGGSTYNLRVMGTPVANAAIWYGTAYSAAGAVTAGTYIAPDTSSTFASRFDSLANTGTCIYVKCTSNADIVDGSAMHASVQSVGSAMSTVYGLTRAQVLQLKGIGPMRNTTDSTHRCAFQSNDWEADFGYASPTGGVSATSGCCLIDIVSTVALTYEVTCFQTWAGVPLSDNKQDVATMDFTDPAKVAIAYAAGNQAMPPTDPRRAVVPPGNVKPPSWTDRVGAGVLGVVDGVRGVFDSSKSWLERGAAGLGALRSFGTVASNFLGLFSAQEKMVRKLYSMTEEERVFLWHFARTHECPTTLEMQTAVNYYWAKRQAARGRRLTPKALEYLAAVEGKSELLDLADDPDGYVVPLSQQGGHSATRLPLASPAVEGAGTGAQPAVPLASERLVFRRAPAVPAAL